MIIGISAIAKGELTGLNAAILLEIDSSGNKFPLTACSRTYGYDANNNLTTDTATDGTNTWVRTFTYNAAGLVATESKWIKS